MRTAYLTAALWLALGAASAQSREQKMPRAIVVDIANTTHDRHAAVLPAATDALAVALTKSGAYDVVSRRELDRAAAERHLKPPYDNLDLATLAKHVGASAIVSGELRYIEVRGRAPQREIEVGILVRVKDVVSGEMINGAAERGTATEPADGSKTDYAILIDSAIAAAERCAQRVSENRPIIGTVLNNQSNELVVINKGIGDGVKKGQEFVAYRGGVAIARLRMFKPFGQYTLLKVTEANMGVQPQDRVVAVFQEPKFGK